LNLKEKKIPIKIPPVTETWDDIDEFDHCDPMHVAAFVNDIYDFLREKEVMKPIPYNYLSRQPNINSSFRKVMVDWLSEVHFIFQLIPETFFLCIDIFDRYLSSTTEVLHKQKLQLIGVTSLLIACKYEELFSPECNDFIYISDNALTKEQILEMEQLILKTTDFYLTHPSPLVFLRRFSKAASSNFISHTLCKFIIEMSLMEVDMLKYPPSHIAAAAVYISRTMLKIQPRWSPNLEHYSNLKIKDIKNCVLDLNQILISSRQWSQNSIRRKYGEERTGYASLVPLVKIT